MAKTPMIRQASILGSIPNLAVLALFVCAGFSCFARDGMIYGAAAFFVLRFALRSIPHDHRAGVALVRSQQFADAIPHFLRSFDFFESKRWLDDYRAFLLLSPSSASYREMAMANAAFCYAQAGDGANARKYYERCLELFPDSMLATTALAMLNAGTNSSDA
ncbi:Tetratricopeptide repeat-containing protein [Neorhodopirellula lusitana]|uniref:Tetratricopeptide repeat-containing protein n=2 Tax=Neorhodopirellula lusitana TaxID=445327 RepID=A0ABY1PV06_9BACT|nr:Tetratricopeptide repeat-containing protein [Neorhodopirellula lusitana]